MRRTLPILIAFAAGLAGGVLSSILVPNGAVGPDTPGADTYIRAASPPSYAQAVEAQAFVLVDAEARVRGKWTVEKGTPMFVLAGSDSRPRIVLAELPNGNVCLSLLDREAVARIYLETSTDGGCRMRLSNHDGTQTRILLAVGSASNPGGEVGVISLHGPRDTPLVTVGAIESTAQGSMQIHDHRHHLIWAAP